MQGTEFHRYRYHASGSSSIRVRGLVIPMSEYLYSDVPLLTAADLAANTAVIVETDIDLTGTWTFATGTRVTPPDPTLVSGVVGESSVKVTWTDSANIDVSHYEIDVSPSVTGQPFSVLPGVQNKIITGMTDGTAYTITVKAVDGGGNKSTGVVITKTPTDVTPPADVTSINAIKGAAASQTVTLTWVDPTDNVGVNHIEIDVTDEVGNTFTGSPFSVATGVGTKAITGLTTGTTYVFTVKGVDAAGNKSPGVVTRATPL